MCDNSSTLEVIRLVKISITIITILVPILLLITSSITFMKVITSSDGSTSKALKVVSTKLIAAIIIFLVPLFIRLVVAISSSDFEYKKCYDSATVEGIRTAKVNETKVLVNEALTSLDSTSFQVALSAVQKLDDSPEKRELFVKLANVQKTIELKNKIDQALVNGNEDDYKNLLFEVNQLESSNTKNELLRKLKQLKEKLDKEKQVSTSQATEGAGETKVYNKNISLNYYTASTGQGFSYWLYVPDNATTNLPIVLYMHGLGERGDDYHNNTKLGIVSGPIKEINTGKKNYNAIIIQPQVPSGQKSQSYGKAYTELATKIANNTNANKKKISISGFSNGCYGVMAIVNQYQSFFSAAVAMGCTPSGPSSFRTTPLWMLAGSGDGVGTMPGFVNQVKAAGGEAYYTQASHHSHNIVSDGNYSAFVEHQLVEWMISKSRN